MDAKRLSKKDRYYLGKAAQYAEYSELRIRVGAYSDAMVGGWNMAKTHPKLAKWGYPEHSQIHGEATMALWNYAKLDGAAVYVVRLARNGEWALAKPCVHCMALLVAARARRVVWSTGPGTVESMRIT